MAECIDPTAIKEGDLMAYLEGEASEQVCEHIERCPAWTDEAARLRETSRALFELMYRADCPAPEILAQHQMGLLSPAEQLKIAAHVRACPHCAQELEELANEAEGQDSLVQMVTRVLDGVVQTVEATMIPRGRPHRVGVRGAEDSGVTFHFHAEDIDILVGLQPSAPSVGTRMLLGAVVQTEALTSGRAWLFREGEKPISSPVDRLGTFTFAALPPGEYDLALAVGRKALLMRGVVV